MAKGHASWGTAGAFVPVHDDNVQWTSQLTLSYQFWSSLSFDHPFSRSREYAKKKKKKKKGEECSHL